MGALKTSIQGVLGAGIRLFREIEWVMVETMEVEVEEGLGFLEVVEPRLFSTR